MGEGLQETGYQGSPGHVGHLWTLLAAVSERLEEACIYRVEVVQEREVME